MARKRWQLRASAGLFVPHLARASAGLFVYCCARRPRVVDHHVLGKLNPLARAQLVLRRHRWRDAPDVHERSPFVPLTKVVVWTPCGETSDQQNAKSCGFDDLLHPIFSTYNLCPAFLYQLFASSFADTDCFQVESF